MKKTGMAAALGVTLALLTTGCADDPTYDPSAIESYLQSSQGSAFDGQEVGAATCPEDVALSEDVRIPCTLEVGGQPVPYQVRLSHVDAQEVTVVAVPQATVIPTEKAEEYVLGSLPSDADGATVTCGQGAVLVVQAGASISCTVGLGSQTVSVLLEVIDDAGTVRVAG
jgi:hypothetical protein